MYLLPVPHSLIYKKENFTICYDTKIILNHALDFRTYNYAKILQNQIYDSLSFTLDIQKAEKETNQAFYFVIEPTLKKDEYQLSIQKNSVRIMGGSNMALLYSIQTLRQIISQCGAILPGIDIVDFPQIKHRAFYYDVTRGRIPTLETLKALADKASFYKLNQLQLYVEHSFLFQDFSEVWRDDTPLTAQEILEFDQYCYERNIELVPSIASFGHLHKILSTKTYQSLCEIEEVEEINFSFMSRMEHHTVDVTNEKSFEMIHDMLNEFLPLFSSKRFNICGDETFDLGKGKSKKLAAKIGIDRLYIDFLKRICSIITDKGKQPMFWGDILIEMPEVIKELPENSICLNWDYGTQVTDMNVKKLHEIGVKQYICPGVHGWRRLINHYENAYENISRMCQYAHSYKAEGVLNTDWGDYGHINHPEFSTVGLIYGAVFSWSKEIIDFDEINKQISLIEYMDRMETFVSIVNRIGSHSYFLWYHMVQYKELMQRHRPLKEINHMLHEVSINDMEKANKTIIKAIEQLYQGIIDMDSMKRKVIKPYIIAAKGIMICNQIGILIYKHTLDHGIQIEIDPKELAVKLEYWFKDYKDIWRAQNKESELYRITEVVVWYADYLREL